MQSLPENEDGVEVKQEEFRTAMKIFYRHFGRSGIDGSTEAGWYFELSDLHAGVFGDAVRKLCKETTQWFSNMNFPAKIRSHASQIQRDRAISTQTTTRPVSTGQEQASFQKYKKIMDDFAKLSPEERKKKAKEGIEWLKRNCPSCIEAKDMYGNVVKKIPIRPMGA